MTEEREIYWNGHEAWKRETETAIEYYEYIACSALTQMEEERERNTILEGRE